MSYCVNCGVELDRTATLCPLCETPVYNPHNPPDLESPTPYPVRRSSVTPVSRRGVGLLLTAMLASVCLICVLMEMLLEGRQPWAFYLAGAAVMLWVWMAVPLLIRCFPVVARVFLDVCAVGLYLYLISLALEGQDWYLKMVLPIVLLGAVLAALLGGCVLPAMKSSLSRVAVSIGTVAVFLMGVERFTDLWLYGLWQPGWSMVSAIVCLALILPLVIVRYRPQLREESRRKLHW